MKTYWRKAAYLVRNTLNIYVNRKYLENIYKEKKNSRLCHTEV